MNGQDLIAAAYWLTVLLLVAAVLRPRTGGAAGAGAGKVETPTLDRRPPAVPSDATAARRSTVDVPTVSVYGVRCFQPTVFDRSCAEHAALRNELVVRVPTTGVDHAVSRPLSPAEAVVH